MPMQRLKVRKALTLRQKRHKRVRAKVSGTPQRPRLNVFRSDKHIYAQVIDDDDGKTLASASTKEKSLAGKDKIAANSASAKVIGRW